MSNILEEDAAEKRQRDLIDQIMELGKMLDVHKTDPNFFTPKMGMGIPQHIIEELLGIDTIQEDAMSQRNADQEK